MKADDIQAEMVEHRQYDATSGETQYRWDFGIHHVADKYNDTMGDELAWLERARAWAAALIARMVEKR